MLTVLKSTLSRFIWISTLYFCFMLISNTSANAECNEQGSYIICEDWDTGPYPSGNWPRDRGGTWHGWESSDYGCGPDGALDTSIKHSGTRSLKKVGTGDCVVDISHDISPKRTKVYVRFYLRIGRGDTARLRDASYAHLIFLDTAQSAEVALDFRDCQAKRGSKYINCGGIYLVPHSYNPEVWEAETQGGAPFDWRNHEEEWVLVEWMADYDQNRTKLWLNEVLRVDMQMSFSGSADSIHISGFTGGSGKVSYWLDDFVVSTNYIGPRGGGGGDQEPPDPPNGLKITNQ